MRTIHKFIAPMPVGSISIPQDAIFLTAEMQGDEPVMWFEVDTNQPIFSRNFEIVGTGQEVPEGAIYLATFQIRSYVWHLYERIKS